jgi:two-component system nitrogen regulation sensor histidine kinase NtrY
MNAEPDPRALQPAESLGVRPRGRSWPRRVADILLGKGATLVLAAIAVALGIATFAMLAGGLHVAVLRHRVFPVLLINLIVLLLLGAVLAGRLTRVWAERRRGSAGAQLHVRLVLLFSVVAITPTIVVAVFASFLFSVGIQAWFNDRVRTALDESLEASRGYLQEHRENIRADALAMAADISRAGILVAGDPNRFGAILADQTALRGMTEAVVFEPVTGQIVASAGVMAGLGAAIPPQSAIDLAGRGDVAILGSERSQTVRAVVSLDSTPQLMLMVTRPVDPVILDHMHNTEEAVAEYRRLDQNRSGLQVTLALIFALVALLVLAAAVLIGLVMANQLARPIGRLIMAAERVRAGDLSVRVPEAATGDEVAGLSRAFNRMTGQLSAQRRELMDAYSQLDSRRRFTEAVLAGVSAGVIGLDDQGHIELPNRAASTLLGLDLLAAIGQPLADLVPEFAPLIAAARAAPDKPHMAEVQIGPPQLRRTLLVRLGSDRASGADPRHFSLVASFDDITELQSAQRKAAWADVARRIAHEIKNPLTPIQLSAERLKRRFTREITSDPETFAQCADTIVRHVGDIGRMVDEFSAFARMPQPVIKPDDVARVVREALVLLRHAHPEIEFDSVGVPDQGPVVPIDRRLIGQALTNLLRNAVDAIAARPAGAAGGRVEVRVERTGDEVRMVVSDNGIGLPETGRDRLTEPYVTHKPKGTGLGLAIVKKVMEDHGGGVSLDERHATADWPGGGTVARLCLPATGRVV